MFNCGKRYFTDMPAITVYINCDTRLAINLRLFDLGEDDEFIFAIKNYDYIDSPAVFLFKTTKDKIDPDTGEVIFKITPNVSKNLKQGAFYNFSVRKNAFNDSEETEYKKLTGNGDIILEYGAQDLGVEQESPEISGEITGMRLELINDTKEV